MNVHSNTFSASTTTLKWDQSNGTLNEYCNFTLIFLCISRIKIEFISAAARRAMSIESDEGDVEDNRAGSITSSRSNMSEVCIFQLFQIISDVFGFTEYRGHTVL